MEDKRYCKGCSADVTESMYCHCGNFDLLRNETFNKTRRSTKTTDLKVWLVVITSLVILFFGINQCSAQEIDTLNIKNLGQMDGIYYKTNTGSEIYVLNLDSIHKELEKEFWDNEKFKLFTILDEYLKETNKIIVGYSFIETFSETSSLVQEVYFTSEKKYAPVWNKLWLYSEFFDRLEALEYFSNHKYALDIIIGLSIDYDKVEPIYVSKEKTLINFYKWLKQ